MGRIIFKYLAIITLFFSAVAVFPVKRTEADLNQRKNRAGLIYWHGDTSQNKIALTFDDGPSEPATTEILNILDRYGVKVTFFVLGKNAEKYPEVIKRIVLEGHAIANHSYSHPDLLLKLPGQIAWQMDKTENIVFELTGVKTSLFRPPYGTDNQLLFIKARQKGYAVIRWSVSAGDWLCNDPEKIANKVLRMTKNGSIILFHDGRRLKPDPNCEATVKALPIIIEGLQRKGFRMVTVPELLSEAD